MTKSVLSKSSTVKFMRPSELDGEIVAVEPAVVIRVRDQVGIAVALGVAELDHAVARAGERCSRARIDVDAADEIVLLTGQSDQVAAGDARRRWKSSTTSRAANVESGWNALVKKLN